ncbi:hypothetical protein [Azospirillum sp. B510]|uniref:hypothetical protein n=1 Tax=Azospirillum sp. (strain B510) TaxID=137722 RepID=UPI0011D10750|nr:hypothetical protein [Azospirillum sp. B510]
MILSSLFWSVSGRFRKVMPKPAAAHHTRLSRVMKVTQTTKAGQCRGKDQNSFGVAAVLI